MYLKSIEIIGFKSFANKTKLEFKPGMTAIVGPNGCGKSNVSDAVRWVLGEQRARALRGSKMEDVIFNGTDSAKPLGMAEVTLTLADCNATLELDYDEVSITRRVFRSGESGYFLNRKACRLKDIQRLFMDTGVGTDSYSVLEQGKIDQILSARPEDRRSVFEEASGITKYKNDKREALRKLEHTEANLLRLDDVIREVKRQIISLQRQAGKARRYKELSTEMRQLEIYVTKAHLSTYKERASTLDKEAAALEELGHQLQTKVSAHEAETEQIRNTLQTCEERINQALETSAHARSRLDQAEQLIRVNNDRISELSELALRNKQETEEAQIRLETHRADLEEMKVQHANLESEVTAAKAELDAALTAQKQIEEELDAARNTISHTRNKAVDTDQKIAHLQNELHKLEANDRENLLKRERLTTEKNELNRVISTYKEQEDELLKNRDRIAHELQRASENQIELTQQKEELEKNLFHQRQEEQQLLEVVATKSGQLDLLTHQKPVQRGFSKGAELLLKEPDSLLEDTHQLLGPLSELMSIQPEAQLAVECALRSLLDAILVRSPEAAKQVLEKLHSDQLGSIRLLHIAENTSSFSGTAAGTPIIEYIQCDPAAKTLLTSLLSHIYLVKTPAEIPTPIPADLTYVTPEGLLISAQRSELYQPISTAENPIANSQLKHALEAEVKAEQTKAEAHHLIIRETLAKKEHCEETLSSAKQQTDTLTREHALIDGELQMLLREKNGLSKRLETAEYELNSILSSSHGKSDNRGALAEEIQEQKTQLAHMRSTLQEETKRLNSLDEKRAQAFETSTEKRLHHAHCLQRVDQLQAQRIPHEARIEELQTLIRNRTSGIDEYGGRISQLTHEIQEAEAQRDPLHEQVEQSSKRLEDERTLRTENLVKLEKAEQFIREDRGALERNLRERSKMEVEQAENQMRTDNLTERITGAYKISLEQLQEEPDPTWEEDEKPSIEQIDTRVAELRAKLDLMGPVNLVAIEEHAELEERFTFLMKEQKDLLSAKDQLLGMIKTINKTTTELFEDTFNRVNKEFQQMFKQLFGGGSAKLVLTDEEDILESGIEIIARPPGKKLQSISLLSGGERTMTAVALLFSLFKVKPSPFCVLDELDAALDDANINRFIDALKGFLHHSQFILITHSRQTIAAADVIYGVTMESRGISKIVSMQFADINTKKEPIKETS